MATDTFNPAMLGRRQKRQLERDGFFTTSDGRARDGEGNFVDNPVPRSQQVTQEQAGGMSLRDLSVALADPVASPTPATEVAPAPNINLPEPAALESQQTFNTGVQGTVDAARANLTDVLGKQREDLDTQIAELKKEQDAALKEGKELTQPFREDLEKKERERLKINENFEANQKLVGELETLLTQSNELIQIATGRQVSGKVLDKSLSKTLADVQARTGVIEAVYSARNGQISQAYTMIDRTVDAIVADRNDELSYYNTIINLTDADLLNLENEKYELAKTARDEAVKQVDSAQATADYIKGLMINPETAQFIADAGVTLTDTVEEINAKMGEHAGVQQVIDTQNTLVEAGYEISPVPVPGGVEFEVNGQKIYAKVREGSELALRLEQAQAGIAQTRASTRASNASAARNETGRLLDLAAAGDLGAIQALGLTLPDESVPSADLMALAADYASNGQLPSSSSLPKGITVGQVAEMARSMPKPDGAIVSLNTGVVSDNLSASEREGITAMNEIVNDTLPELMRLWGETQDFSWNPISGVTGETGLVGGIKSSILPSDDMTRYLQTRDEFLSKLLVARSGAAVTEQEYQRYLALVPGQFNQPLGFGRSGEVLLDNLDDLMVTNFDNFLSSNQLSVYGYSTVDLGEQLGTYTVGETIENEYGQQGFVQPDGSVTLINP